MTKKDIQNLFETTVINMASEKEMLYQALDEADTITKIIEERLHVIGE